MKQLIVIALCLILANPASAQEARSWKRMESNLQLGAGLFGETGRQARDVFPGLALRLSYGLDFRLDEKWSVMPGAGVFARQGEIHHLGWVGGDPEAMTMADVFCQLRYHFEAQGDRIVLGLGPELSYMIAPDRYYIDADPMDPRGGKEKFEKWDIGLQPSLIFQTGKRFQWGFEANVGVRNMLRQYPEYNVTGRVHLHNLLFICGWRF